MELLSVLQRISRKCFRISPLTRNKVVSFLSIFVGGLFMGVSVTKRLLHGPLQIENLPTNVTFSDGIYRILWYNPPLFLTTRPEAKYSGFTRCKFSNCAMLFDQCELERSHAVIFYGRHLRQDVLKPIRRPLGQVWIFAADESPVHYNIDGDEWSDENWRHRFNWTMTYDKTNTDIFLPYGKLQQRTHANIRNYSAIALQKSRGGILISSHCNNKAEREKYAKILQRYIPIDIKGKCGHPWTCGTQYVHDNCFDILNSTYKFFLAFENSLCRGYFTEKLFENYNYDTLIVTRGGGQGEASATFPSGTVISTDSFQSVDELGEYLAALHMSPELYAERLKDKDKFYADSYSSVYQNAMCRLCEMMNKQDHFRKQIPDTFEWAYSSEPCRVPDDIPS